MCNEAINALDFGKNFYSTPMLSVLLNRPIQSSDDLKCDFVKRGLDCLWANLDGEKAQWEIGLGTIDKSKFSSLTRRLTVPSKFYFYFQIKPLLSLLPVYFLLYISRKSRENRKENIKYLDFLYFEVDQSKTRETEIKCKLIRFKIMVLLLR